MKKLVLLPLVLIMILGLSYREARAYPFRLDIVDAYWIDVDGGRNVRGLFSNKITWGYGVRGKSSGLKFANTQNTPRQINWEPFRLGTLIHTNEPIYFPSHSASLALEVVINGFQTITYIDFLINETLNSPCFGRWGCPDIITWNLHQTEDLLLLGFGNSDNYISQFVTPETGMTRAKLWASLNPFYNGLPIVSVSEPALMFLVGLGILGMVGLVRNRRK